ncbi:MAG: thioredoxin family protein [Rhodospirillaceae bacterium]|nr:thioredoxin family protein [Rhodospirillaceae bacterium]
MTKRRAARPGRHWISTAIGAGFAALAVLCAAALPAAAATGAWGRVEVAPDAVVEVRLIASVDAVGDLAAIPAGLQVRLPEHWKTYWRAPGDAGYPPDLDLAASVNLAGQTLQFPAPHRFTVLDIDTIGYEGEVVFPLTLEPETVGNSLLARGEVNLLVCSEICVPARVPLSLVLPQGPADADADAAHLIDRFADQVPTADAARAGFAVVGVAGNADGLHVVLASTVPLDAPDLFVEAPQGWAFAPPVVHDLGNGRMALNLAVTQRPIDPDRTLTGAPVTLTVVDGPRALEFSGTVARPTDLAPSDAVITDPAAGAAAADPADSPSWLGLLGIALFGGLILNLMPCVLPVLSIKLFSVIGHGGRTPAAVRAGFLASAAGVIASFWVLALGLIALQAAGAGVGWGIQFQQPAFLAAMVVVLAAFACNLLGLYEIRLPGALGDRAGRMGDGHDGLAGPFLTGAFATVLATPCSAPFVGTAVAFALSRGPLEILAIFTALAVGLAAPYLLVAAFPHLAARLPRPGRWMVWVKLVMAVALAATAAWLLSILAVQTSPLIVAAVAGLSLLLGAALWLRGHSGPRLRPAGTLAALALAAAAIAVPEAHDPGDADGPSRLADLPTGWQRFQPETIAAQVAAGRTVFVDLTADWCLTCQVNKALVLDDRAVADRLAGETITAMRGDWTRPDPEIARFLADHGRYGIPFNGVWGPGAPDGILLPELLTVDDVLAALDAASTAATQQAGLSRPASP